MLSSQHVNHVHSNLLEAYNLEVANSATAASLDVSGAANVRGTLSVLGALNVGGTTTLSGTVRAAVQVLQGAGAVGLNTLTTTIRGTTPNTAYTLGAGTGGQLKIVVYAGSNDIGTSAKLTPDNPLGYTDITFGSAGDSALLVYTGTAWAPVALQGAQLN